MSQSGLQYGWLNAQSTVHVCVDMQRLFGPGSPWMVPWMERVLPVIAQLVEQDPSRTVFTRFIPAARANEAPGLWKQYYRKWENLTLEWLDPELLTLAGPLSGYVPPAAVIDKFAYSPWTEGTLENLLRSRLIDTLVVTGGETDICVLATLLGAIDRGYRVVLVADGVCSSADATHDALMKLYRKRFSKQLEIASSQEVLAMWR